MELDQLRTKRQLNVQQQNMLTEHEIEAADRWFKANLQSIPSPILALFESMEIVVSESCFPLFQCLSDLGLAHCYSGLILSQCQVFYQWELELSDDEKSIAYLEEWKNVSCDYPITEHLRGRGKSFGFLCLKVQQGAL